MKISTSWHSERLDREVQMVRWGEVGVPVLIFPTAGGDAEEIERFLMIDALADLLEAGRIKVYSCDSVAGQAIATGEGSPAHRMWVMNQFQEYVRHEVVPAVFNDCQTDHIDMMAAGASIGAFNALAVTCRYPEVFGHAICMSGTYDLKRFLKTEATTDDFYYSSPIHYLEGLNGNGLEQLRERFVLLASGEGRAEDIDESWRVASVLGRRAVPNRVDSWGAQWHHDWPTWRRMLPQYLDEFAD